jgi:multidrug efflux pump subunit AcrB
MKEIGLEVQDYFMQFVDDDPDRFDRSETEVPAIRYLNTRISAGGFRIISEPVRPADIDELMDAITAKYREYPGMRAFAARGSIISSNDGGTRSINLDVSGPNLGVIYAAALATYRRAEDVFGNPRIQTSPSSLSLSQPMLEVQPDWARAAELGLTAGDVGYTVAALTDGAFVDEYFEADDKIDMYLYGTTGGQTDVDNLGGLPIYTPQGSIDTNSIRRINGQRTVTLNIIPPTSIPLEVGVEIVRNDVVAYLRDSGALPGTVNVDISGASDQLDATKAALAANLPVALIIVFLLLVAILKHWGYPLLIMTTIPLGIAGGIVGLTLLNLVGSALEWLGLGSLHQPFDMISMLGFLILMGTVVNNPILIVDRAMQHMKTGNMSPIDAVREAVASRIRPIAMSTLTTICGLSPLVFIPGAGTELYRGVGAIVLFGILGAAIVSVTMLPALTISVLEWNKSREARTSLSR